jgi:predicted kinase
VPAQAVADERTTRPTMYVMVGLPASGKTTRARELEAEQQALRLTPDEWMIRSPGTRRSTARGTSWRAGSSGWLQAIRAGAFVVLDFGLWGRDERSALRWLASWAATDCDLVYLPVDPVEQERRVTARLATGLGSTFELGPQDLHGYRALSQEPTEDELSSAAVGPPPTGHPTWTSWVAERWPRSTS